MGHQGTGERKVNGIILNGFRCNYFLEMEGNCCTQHCAVYVICWCGMTVTRGYKLTETKVKAKAVHGLDFKSHAMEAYGGSAHSSTHY
jgi:hypothetical protein